MTSGREGRLLRRRKAIDRWRMDYLADDNDRLYSLLLDSYYPEQIAADLERFHRPYLREALRIVAEEQKRPAEEALAASIRSETARYRQRNRQLDLPELAAVFNDSEERALAALRSICERAPQPPRPGASRLRLKSKVRITGNLPVERSAAPGGISLSWRAHSPVREWVVRIAERSAGEQEYGPDREQRLPAGTTTVVIPLAEDVTYRLQIVGQSATGRVSHRALILPLSTDNWQERWERRASAS